MYACPGYLDRERDQVGHLDCELRKFSLFPPVILPITASLYHGHALELPDVRYLKRVAIVYKAQVVWYGERANLAA